MESEKLDIKIGVMSLEQQEKLAPFLKLRKYQVEMVVLEKRKYAYCDDLKDLDQFVKGLGARIIEVREIKKDV